MKAFDPPPTSLLEGAALFLDFDGTLVELADTPDAIEVPGRLPHLLRRIADRLDGRVAIVSGRSIADLDRHLECSGMAVSGSHGLEHRLAGEALPAAAPAVDLRHVETELERFAARIDGLLIERKPASIALHYRRVPDKAERVERFMDELARQSGLSLQAGKMVFELRPAGADKGDAVRTFMAEPQFKGARPLFMGDDVTDEDGFRAVAALDGSGILVGPPRPSAARYRLDDVAAVADWLERALG